MKPGESLKSSLRNEAMHIAIMAKSMVGETGIYKVEESIQMLKKKINTLMSFSGR